MSSKRLEAFFDAVIAILITLMALELQVPSDATFKAFLEVLPHIITYIISFIFIAILWINHHHLFSLVMKVNNKVVWTNLIFLFFISLIPYLTQWVTDTHYANIPVLFYGVNMLICFKIYDFLLKEIQYQIFGTNHSILLLKEQGRVNLSYFIAIVAIVLLFILDSGIVSFYLYILILLSWLIPSTVFESYHEVIASGVDITDGFEQFKIAFSDKERKQFERRIIKFRSNAIRKQKRKYFSIYKHKMNNDENSKEKLVKVMFDENMKKDK